MKYFSVLFVLNTRAFSVSNKTISGLLDGIYESHDQLYPSALEQYLSYYTHILSFALDLGNN